jgi:phage terminase large subunit GpA-like protein
MTNRLFRSAWFPALVARIFAIRPRETIWEWAEKNVFLTTTMAPEPTFYDSKKTPWTRRLQELLQHPYHNGRRIKRVVIMKSSQTGFTEAILNFIRWLVKFAPRNVIYAIDSQEEAANISDRLRNTLDALGEEILTDDKKDITARKMTLRHMILWFFGSAAQGKFANKQAPVVVCDEIEEYKKITGETSAVGNAASRMKKSAEGILIELSKPKLKGGQIDKDHALGDQEVYLVPCPHCGTFQEIVFERLQFKHCKNLMGEWDKERVLNEIFLKCANEDCDKPILESHRYGMAQRGRWEPTVKLGAKDYDPEIISMQMSDLYDCDNPRVWGEIAKEVIAAAGNHKKRQEVWNHRLGRPYLPTTTKPEAIDVIRCKSLYRRRTIPFTPLALILASDVGKEYAKWGVGAVDAADNIALIDWGSELHPSALVAMLQDARYHCPSDDKFYPIWQGVVDAGHRMEDCYAACLQIPGRLWPCKGGGGPAMKQTLSWNQLPTYPDWLKLLAFNDREFKSELYLRRIKRAVPEELDQAEAKKFLAKMPRLILPEDVTPDVIIELTNEHYEEDPETGEWEWNRKGPNEIGDIIKEMCVLWRYAKRQFQVRPPSKESE